VQVRCVLHVPDAFYLGEVYAVEVDATSGVGGAETTFRVEARPIH
jgi:hypothetical protein